jgi:hypothetical protein
MSTRRERILEQLVVKPGTDANLAGRDPGWTGGPDYEGLSQAELKAESKAVRASGVEELADAKELLWASDTYALLVVFQAMDAAGKDSAIEHVMSGVNPRRPGRLVREALVEELDHDYLWRTAKALPEGDASASSTARTTRRSSRCAYTLSGSTSSSCPPRPAARGSGTSATRTSMPSSATSTGMGRRS